MGQRIDMELILNIGSDLQCFFGFASACAVGDADEIRLQNRQPVQNGESIGKIIFLLRGNTSKERVGFFSLKMSLIMFFLTSVAMNRSHFLLRCGSDGYNRSCYVRLRKGHRMLTHVE